MRVVGLVGIVVLALVADLRAADGLAAADARLARVGHRHCELTGVNIADCIGGEPNDSRRSYVEFLVIQRGVGRINRKHSGSSQLIEQRRVKSTVIGCASVPLLVDSLMMSMVFLIRIVVLGLVARHGTRNLRRRHILHNHVEGTFRVVSGSIHGFPRHQGRAVVELLALE